MTCETFRARFAPATEDPVVLEHIRACDSCLAVAVDADPDVMFRAIGGEMVPAGGVDAFVGDVMREVRLRKTETTAKHRTPWMRRLAIAATAAIAITAATSVYFNGRTSAPVPVAIARTSTPQTQFTTRPAVEMYQSESATIVEVPAGASEDVKVVMVFDESLPADL